MIPLYHLHLRDILCKATKVHAKQLGVSADARLSAGIVCLRGINAGQTAHLRGYAKEASRRAETCRLSHLVGLHIHYLPTSPFHFD